MNAIHQIALRLNKSYALLYSLTSWQEISTIWISIMRQHLVAFPGISKIFTRVRKIMQLNSKNWKWNHSTKCGNLIKILKLTIFNEKKNKDRGLLQVFHLIKFFYIKLASDTVSCSYWNIIQGVEEFFFPAHITLTATASIWMLFPINGCSKLTTETLEQDVKYIQS